MTVIDAIKGYDIAKLNEEFNNTIKSSYPLDSEQAQYVHSIVKELAERGEIENCSEEKADENYLLLLKRCKEVIDSLPKDAHTVDVVLELFQRSTNEELLTFRAGFFPRENDRLSGLDAEAPRPRPPRRRFIRPALIAACAAGILILANTIVAHAFGFNFFSSLVRWTQESVMFGNPVDKQPIDTEYSRLVFALDVAGIQVDLPRYLPDGFILDTIEPDEPTEFLPIIAWFVRGDEEFHIWVKRIIDDDTMSASERNDEIPSEPYKGKFYIEPNMQRMSAVWRQDSYELSIHGDLTYEELMKILDSI
jgi:hypothetical protein